MEKNRKKIDLNKTSHSVRASQAVLQYGVGAMVDFPDQTLTTAAPESWDVGRQIFDERLAKALGVRYFRAPGGRNEYGNEGTVAYERFPEWYFCPKCRKFKRISEWVSDLRKKTPMKDGDVEKFKKNTAKRMICSECKQPLVVTRIVTVCKNGHINDFPWDAWVHHNKNCTLARPSLKIKTSATGSEGLEGILVSCECGAYETLNGAFDPKIFRRKDEGTIERKFICGGNHPHRHKREVCELYPRTMQRGSSSVYFPAIVTSLVIPPFADRLNRKIEESNEFKRCLWRIDEKKIEDEKKKLISDYVAEWSHAISSEIDEPPSSVENILRRKLFDDTEYDVHDSRYLSEEYEALSGEVRTTDGLFNDFIREEIDISRYGGLPIVKSVSLINKIRVVKVQIGFSRMDPILDTTDERFVSVKEKQTPWYPAYEVRGEGIFIEFDQEKIDEWLKRGPDAIARVEEIDRHYKKSFMYNNRPIDITPKFVVLHTISHMLIKQLSFECGYNIASLCERIYSAEESDGKQMAGILIYTASGDSEGTLGGLVRQGHPDVFPGLFQKAIENAGMCSNDPVCILSSGQGRESLNLAACHSCALLPETCCSDSNGLLDRGLIIGTFSNRNLGLFSNVNWKQNHPGP